MREGSAYGVVPKWTLKRREDKARFLHMLTLVREWCIRGLEVFYRWRTKYMRRIRHFWPTITGLPFEKGKHLLGPLDKLIEPRHRLKERLFLGPFLPPLREIAANGKAVLDVREEVQLIRDRELEQDIFCFTALGCGEDSVGFCVPKIGRASCRERVSRLV